MSLVESSAVPQFDEDGFMVDPHAWNEDVAEWIAWEDGIKIYFENEEDRQKYLDLGKDHRIVLQGNDTDEYVAEG
jgi:sulfur relay (sulfurtransferase) DsrC/TusE family protein